MLLPNEWASKQKKCFLLRLRSIHLECTTELGDWHNDEMTIVQFKLLNRKLHLNILTYLLKHEIKWALYCEKFVKSWVVRIPLKKKYKVPHKFCKFNIQFRSCRFHNEFIGFQWNRFIKTFSSEIQDVPINSIRHSANSRLRRSNFNISRKTNYSEN